MQITFCQSSPVRRDAQVSNGAAQHEPIQNDPLGDMYHDLTFDLVHYNVAVFTTSRYDFYLPTDAGRYDQLSSQLRSDPDSRINMRSPSQGIINTPFYPRPGTSPTRVANQSDYPNETPVAGRSPLLASSPTTAV